MKDKVSSIHKELLVKLQRRDANKKDPIQALALLSQMLRDTYDRPVLASLMNNDVPIARALETPFYSNVRDKIEQMLSPVCRTNSNVKGVILAGCLPVLKNSIYTGVNNLILHTVLSSFYASSTEFTDEDVRKLLEDAGLSDLYDTVEEWYGGYLFDRDRMYFHGMCFPLSAKTEWFLQRGNGAGKRLVIHI